MLFYQGENALVSFDHSSISSESLPAQDLQLVGPDADAAEPALRRPHGHLHDERLPDGHTRPRPRDPRGRPQGLQAQPLQTHAGKDEGFFSSQLGCPLNFEFPLLSFRYRTSGCRCTFPLASSSPRGGTAWSSSATFPRATTPRSSPRCSSTRRGGSPSRATSPPTRSRR